MAQEIYDELTKNDLKVFFSRITLEDKLGVDYEPYIFAALQSAKVMLVVTTSLEYVEAVWVKNEWGRFSRLAAEDTSKVLIPCYSGIDPEDLPNALNTRQAQDMDKLGAMQDLVRGVVKIIGKNQKTVIKIESANIENLIKRGALALEDGDWSSANKFYEQILDEDVEEYRAYLGKLCAELEINFEKDLVNVGYDFSASDNYKKAIRFADEGNKKRIEEYNLQSMYNQAMEQFNMAKNDIEYLKAKELFDRTPDYNDCMQMSKNCTEKASESIYTIAEDLFNKAKTESDYRNAKEYYIKIENYKDSKRKIVQCQDKITILNLSSANDIKKEPVICLLLKLLATGVYMYSCLLFGIDSIFWIIRSQDFVNERGYAVFMLAGILLLLASLLLMFFKKYIISFILNVVGTILYMKTAVFLVEKVRKLLDENYITDTDIFNLDKTYMRRHYPELAFLGLGLVLLLISLCRRYPPKTKNTV